MLGECLSWLVVSCGPPGRLPIMFDGSLVEAGDGDLGGEEDRGGASTGGFGSSTAVVCAGLCEGVWLLDETWVTAGETAGGESVRLPAHRTERIDPGVLYWRARLGEYTAGPGQRTRQQIAEKARTRRGVRGRRRRRGGVLVSSNHLAMFLYSAHWEWTRSSIAEACCCQLGARCWGVGIETRRVCVGRRRCSSARTRRRRGPGVEQGAKQHTGRLRATRGCDLQPTRTVAMAGSAERSSVFGGSC